MNDLIEYQSHKRVHASPMTDSEYLALYQKKYKEHNMALPQPTITRDVKLGYLVVYSKDTNDEYWSWSPKKQFEEGYSYCEAVLPAPLTSKLTPEDIEAVQVASEYHVFKGTCLTVCNLTLKNGFNVVGHSACANPDIFDEEIGRQEALKDAVRKVWELEGYLLKQRYYEKKTQTGIDPRVRKWL